MSASSRALRLAGLLSGLLGAGACSPAPERVLLVSIDTLRADHVGCYGGAGARTPSLDALAVAGVRFETAVSPTPLTLPSHASLMTGLDPPRHGVRNNSTFRLAAGIPTLAERLRDAGFATAAFVGTVVLDRQYGLERGFQVYDDRMSLHRASGDQGFAERSAERVVAAASEWLASAEGRFFLWVHLYDPHADYAPPPAYRSGSTPEALYAGEIAYADAELGRLLALLAARFDAARTLVVVASDHGESLGEHGEVTHSLGVYDATQRVPLLLRGPGLPAGRVVSAPVRLVDVAPTLLALLGLPPLPGADGADLRPLIAGREPQGRVAYLETLATQLDLGWSPLLALRTAHQKYIRAPRPELYDLRADPGETRNLAGERPGEVAELDRQLEARLGGAEPAAARVEPDAGQRARLEALGYVAVPALLSPGELGRVGGTDPKDGLPLLHELAAGYTLLWHGRPREALRRLRELEGGGFELEALRSRAALGAGDLEAAEAYARAALARAPGFANGRVQLGEVLLARGQPDAARAAFEAAAALDAAAAEPWVGLGRLAEARGERARARELYERAAGQRSGSAEAVWRLAALRLEDGETEAANRALRELPPRARESLEAVKRLALAETRAGLVERARLRIELAERVHPGSEELMALREELRLPPPR